MLQILSIFTSLILILLVLTPTSAYAAADSTIGNEILNVSNASLVRSGAGTAASPYTVALNLSHSNTWLSPQTFNTTVTVNSVLQTSNISNSGNLTSGGDIAVNGGDISSNAASGTVFNTNVATLAIGGAATTLTLGASSGATTINNNLSVGGVTTVRNLTTNLVDNMPDALDVQEGTNNYMNVSTTNGSETVSFGNNTTNPIFLFQGGGPVFMSGDVAVNGGDIVTTATTGTLFNTHATTVNIAGAASALTMGANFGSTTIRSATIVFPNANTLFAGSALLTVDSMHIGGGYGSSGVTLSTNGNMQTNGNMIVDGMTMLTGAVSTLGSVTFTPSASNDITVNTDSDSHVIVTGLATSMGTPLCLDASDVLVRCTESGASMSAAVATAVPSDTATLEATVQKQQEEITLLRQEIEALKARLQ